MGAVVKNGVKLDDAIYVFNKYDCKGLDLLLGGFSPKRIDEMSNLVNGLKRTPPKQVGDIAEMAAMQKRTKALGAGESVMDNIRIVRKKPAAGGAVDVGELDNVVFKDGKAMKISEVKNNPADLSTAKDQLDQAYDLMNGKLITTKNVGDTLTLADVKFVDSAGKELDIGMFKNAAPSRATIGPKGAAGFTEQLDLTQDEFIRIYTVFK